MTITHTFVSAIADDGAAQAAGQVLPQAHWNAAHTVTAPDFMLQKVTRDLTTAEIAALNSSPITLVAAQGAGTVIDVVKATFQYLAGTEPFGEGVELRLLLGAERVAVTLNVTAGFEGLDSLLVGLVPLVAVDAEVQALNLPLASCENTALRLHASGDPGLTGPILTDSLSNGGADFAPGDTFTVNNSLGGTLAAGEVDTVDGGGAILTYHRTSNGTLYPVGQPSLTATTGIGTGAEINIDTITPLTDGVGRVTVLYYVFDLRS